MLRLTCKIEIDGEKRWVLREVTEIEITRDMEKLTDECKITLPKKIKWDNKTDIPLRRGDKIKVMTGYDDSLELAFVGYVKDVGIKTPLVITCEDEMMALKQKATAKKAYKNATVEQLLKDQGTSYPIKVMGEQNLGAYRVTEDTVAGLLGKLQDQGVKSFFKYENGEPVLYCGVLFDHGEANAMQVFQNGKDGNIVSDSSLEQQKAETMRLKIKAISLMPDNKKVKVEVGDADGELKTLHTYNKAEKELKAWAEQEVKRLKRDGLKGSFTTFGFKLVDKLDNIGLIIDDKKQGIYQVKKNVIKYGTSGYRQEITLGNRVGG